MEDEVDGAAEVGGALVAGGVALSGRRRERLAERRTRRLTPRFTGDELAEIAAAAAAVGMMSPNGFCAEVILKVVRRLAVSYEASQERESLARLQRELFAARTAVNRFGGNVNQAVARLHATGETPTDALTHAVVLCGRAVGNLDALIDEAHRRLR